MVMGRSMKGDVLGGGNALGWDEEPFVSKRSPTHVTKTRSAPDDLSSIRIKLGSV